LIQNTSTYQRSLILLINTDNWKYSKLMHLWTIWLARISATIQIFHMIPPTPLHNHHKWLNSTECPHIPLRCVYSYSWEFIKLKRSLECLKMCSQKKPCCLLWIMIYKTLKWILYPLQNDSYKVRSRIYINQWNWVKR
jgi:hypothetical protein